MSESLRLLCVFAHPDDETLGMGGTLARYAHEGVETYLLTATRGQRGWAGPEAEDPGLDEMGRIRERELHAAAEVLGLREATLLDYVDGELAAAPPDEIIGQIACEIRRLQPQVVVTFGPDGHYGHPDHIAISQFTGAAILCAADASYTDPEGQAPHRIDKLYYMVDSEEMARLLAQYLGGLCMEWDGVERCEVPWQDWAITTRVDTREHARDAWHAVLCHVSQLPTIAALLDLSEEEQQRLFSEGSFYRAISLVNSGREVEHDLFEGLRERALASGVQEGR